MSALSAEAISRAVLQGRPSRSAPPAPSLDFGAPESTALLSPPSSIASSSSSSLLSSGSKRSRRSATFSPSKRAMLRAIPALSTSAPSKTWITTTRCFVVNQILDFAGGLSTDPVKLENDLEQHSERSFRRSEVYYTSSHFRSNLGRSPALAEIDRI
ncbi:hypothetical protein D6D20_10528 [Aureobasidium pullulans]|uniref:Uncharacterized protein n=1 Tax=Aureobasidium pullulans TaxID=5580 RepID=A0A4S8YNP1_AURPU|nr:hypothetical protein D6D20_10528 [Aureobasidium pullulans]